LHLEMRNTMDNLNDVNNSSEKFQELMNKWHELTQTLKSLQGNFENSNGNINNNFQNSPNNQEIFIQQDEGNINFNQDDNAYLSGSNFYATQDNQNMNQFNNENNNDENINNNNNFINFKASNNSNVFNNNLYNSNNNQFNSQGYFDEGNNNNSNENFYKTNKNNFNNSTRQGNNNTDSVFSSQNRNFRQSNLSYNNNEANSSRFGNFRTNENISSSLSNFNNNSNPKNSNTNSNSNKNTKETFIQNANLNSNIQIPLSANATAQNYDGDMDEVIYALNPHNIRTNIFANQNETMYSNNNITNNKMFQTNNNINNNIINDNNYNNNISQTGFYKNNNNTQNNFYESDLNKQINNQQLNYNLTSSKMNQFKSTKAKSSAFSNEFSPFNSSSQINFKNTYQQQNHHNHQNKISNFTQAIPEALQQNENETTAIINQENQNVTSQSQTILEDKEKNHINKDIKENLIDNIVNQYKDKLILNQANVLQDGRFASYDIKMPLEYYHKFAKENEPPKDKAWYIRSHHTESKVNNKEVIADDIMNTKYISYYGEAEKPPSSPSRLNIINDLISGLHENVEDLKRKMHTKAITDKGFRPIYNNLVSLKDVLKSEFVPGKIFEENEKDTKSPRSIEILSGKMTRQKDYSEFFNQNEEVGKTNYIIKSYEALLLELRNKEKEKILEKRKEEYQKIRPPVERWYEIKSKNFNSEMRRNNKVLNSPPEYFEKLQLLQSKNLY
jgi:hypothetical protein